MTELETNRATVLLFCQRLSDRDFTAMIELATADATWWVIGRPDYAPYGGLHKVCDVMQTLDSFVGTLDQFSFTVHSTIAEGDRVVVEATSAGKLGAAIYTVMWRMFPMRPG